MFGEDGCVVSDACTGIVSAYSQEDNVVSLLTKAKAMEEMKRMPS